MVAGEDHVRLLHVDGPLEGCGDLIAHGVDIVHLNVVELVAHQATHLVDLVNGHDDAIAHLDAVGGDEAADREDTADIDVALVFRHGRCLGGCLCGRLNCRRFGGCHHLFCDRGGRGSGGRRAGGGQTGAQHAAGAHSQGRSQEFTTFELLF